MPKSIRPIGLLHCLLKNPLQDRELGLATGGLPPLQPGHHRHQLCDNHRHSHHPRQDTLLPSTQMQFQIVFLLLIIRDLFSSIFEERQSRHTS